MRVNKAKVYGYYCALQLAKKRKSSEVDETSDNLTINVTIRS